LLLPAVEPIKSAIDELHTKRGAPRGLGATGSGTAMPEDSLGQEVGSIANANEFVEAGSTRCRPLGF